jgi:hypothetical protein
VPDRIRADAAEGPILKDAERFVRLEEEGGQENPFFLNKKRAAP